MVMCLTKEKGGRKREEGKGEGGKHRERVEGRGERESGEDA